MAKSVKKKAHRFTLFFLMILSIFTMCFQLTSQKGHEYTGILFGVFILLHLIQQRKFFRRLFHGRYTRKRLFQTLLDLCMIAALLITLVSGVLMSDYALPFLKNSILLNKNKVFHLAACYWFFVLMAFHIGVYSRTLLRRFGLTKINLALRTTVFGSLSAYGLYVFQSSGIHDYLLLRTHVPHFDASLAPQTILFNQIAILVAASSLGYCIYGYATKKTADLVKDAKIQNIVRSLLQKFLIKK